MTRSARAKARPLSEAALATLKDNPPASLSYQQMLVLRLRNGLDGLGVRSQAEVANELGISRQRVVKLERMAVERLERTVGNG